MSDPIIPKAAVAARAGTRLDHRFTRAIVGTGAYGRKAHGQYDKAARVYQGGGEFRQFVYQAKDWISFAADVWAQISVLDLRWIEMVDHELNQVYRIAPAKALAAAQSYTAGGGPRVGVPRALWDVYDAAGVRLREGAAR